MTSESKRGGRFPFRLIGIGGAAAFAVAAGVFAFVGNGQGDDASGGLGGPGQAQVQGQGPGGGPGQARAAGGGFGQRAPAVTLSPVVFAPVDQNLTAIGTGRAAQSLVLNAEVSGVVKQILMAPGQKVEAGAPLVLLEDDQQRIAVAKARADYAIAETNAQRFAGLVTDNAASELENESAKNALTSANAELRRTEFELSQRTIRAPFAGVVGLNDLDVGDFVSVGSQITTIDDVSAVMIDFVIPESASAEVRPGLEITAAAASAGGRSFKGVVTAVDSRIDPASRTQRVEALLSNEERALIPGSTFSISIALPGRQAIATPGLALQWDRAGSFVWKRSVNGVAERVPVVLLKRNPDVVLLDAPLAAGDYIVTEGADIVRAGMPLPDPNARASAAASTGGAVANE